MKIYWGIDPGTYKVGWAFVSVEGELLLSGIVPGTDFGKMVVTFSEGSTVELVRYSIEGDLGNLPVPFVPTVILGGGTSYRYYDEILRKLGYSPDIAPEYGSTLAARPLYWHIHPPRGIRRFFPLSLQVPPRDVDDLAAWRIVLDFLKIALPR